MILPRRHGVSLFDLNSLGRTRGSRGCDFKSAALAALMLLTPFSLAQARAQSAQAAPQPATSAQQTTPALSPQTTGNAASGNSSGDSQQKSLTARSIDKAKSAAKSASDIFSRVPCLPP